MCICDVTLPERYSICDDAVQHSGLYLPYNRVTYAVHMHVHWYYTKSAGRIACVLHMWHDVKSPSYTVTVMHAGVGQPVLYQQ